jgi:hypothetical protein
MTTKRELIEMLEFVKDDDEVVFSFPANDYWKTTIARPINNIEEVRIKASTYHQEDVVTDFDDVDDARRAWAFTA